MISLIVERKRIRKKMREKKVRGRNENERKRR